RSEPAVPPLRALRSLGVEPHIDVVTDGFLSVPFLVAGSDRVAFLHERLARRLAAAVPIRVLRSPVPAPPVTLSLRWHPTLTDDSGHLWFREMLRHAASFAAGESSSPSDEAAGGGAGERG